MLVWNVVWPLFGIVRGAVTGVASALFRTVAVRSHSRGRLVAHSVGARKNQVNRTPWVDGVLDCRDDLDHTGNDREGVREREGHHCCWTGQKQCAPRLVNPMGRNLKGDPPAIWRSSPWPGMGSGHVCRLAMLFGY